MGNTPYFFECHEARKIYYGTRSSTGDPVTRTRIERAQHRVTLTGRTKPRRHPRGGGFRSSDVQREYRCSCGHVGWSSHIDLERMEQRG